ncbi:MAG: ethylbenzene dehydrogenase-related protein [Candidatus Methylomirabilia bacterium]
MPRRQRPQLLSGVCLLLVPVITLLLATVAHAQEKEVSLIFTAELLSLIATDNQGEQSAEIVDRIIGLSPAVLNVRLKRASGRVNFILAAAGADELPVSFQFSIDKMVYYRMRTAPADVTGMTRALQDAKAAEPLLRAVGYRYDGRYSIIDLTIDLRPAIQAAREMQSRREAEERAAAAAKAAADARAKAAEKARAQDEAARAAAAAAAAKTAADKLAAPAPEEKPRPVPQETAPPPPARETAYLAARGLGREAAPVVDGQPSDTAWQAAAPLSFEVAGASGKMTVTAEALWSPDRLWVLVRWPDKTRDDTHRPWVWSKSEKAYVAGREVEDALSLSFAREGRMGECMLAGNEASTDLWTWRAGRTDPSGFAEDATMTLSFQRIARANFYQTRNGRFVWVKEEPDGGSRPYEPQIVGAYAGERIPRYIARTPSGSMADVTAKGSWKNGLWTVEFSRRLSTGDPGDVIFMPGRDVFFSLAVFNSREGIDHSTSKELTLRLE